MRASALVSLAVIIVAAVSTATSIEDAIRRYLRRIPYIIGAPDSGVTSLSRIVPKGETLGFITDRSDGERIDKRLYGLTYSIAPLLVESAPNNRRFIVGDFENRSDTAINLTRNRLGFVEDLGNGFLLLKAWR
jgi:hypothetical protein